MAHAHTANKNTKSQIDMVTWPLMEPFLPQLIKDLSLVLRPASALQNEGLF
jgi:hypothetical protein